MAMPIVERLVAAEAAVRDAISTLGCSEPPPHDFKIEHDALWRWYGTDWIKVGPLEELVPRPALYAKHAGQPWKVESGELWRWLEEKKVWQLIGPLDSLFKVGGFLGGKVLDLPPATVEQALQAAQMMLLAEGARAALCALFPGVGAGIALRADRPRHLDRGNHVLAESEDLRRALALAFRTLSDKLLEVS